VFKFDRHTHKTKPNNKVIFSFHENFFVFCFFLRVKPKVFGEAFDHEIGFKMDLLREGLQFYTNRL